jgi:CHAT domain-containing protein
LSRQFDGLSRLCNGRAIAMGLIALSLAAGLYGCEDGANKPELGDRIAESAAGFENSAGVEVAFDSVTGSSYLARVEQFDFDATLALLDREGRTLQTSASPARGIGREYLFWTATESQPLRLVIRGLARPAKSARYHAEVFKLPANLATDQVRALRSLNQSGPDSPDPLSELQAAAETWRREGNVRLAADASLRLAGQRYFNDERWSDALRAAQRAASEFDALGDATATAGARLLLGAARLELGRAGEQPDRNYPAAYTALSQARELFQREQLPVSAASVLRYQGAGQFSEGDYERAVASYQQAAVEFTAAQAPGERLLTMMNIAAIRSSRGEYRQAVTSFEEALPLLAGSDPQLRATVLQNSATALQAIGRSELALQRYLESLDIANSFKDRSLAARALTGLGVAHLRLGQPALALDYLTQAVAMIRPLEDRDRLAMVLNSLGDAYAGLRDLRAATRVRREAIDTLSITATPMRRARLTVALANELANEPQPVRALALYSSVVLSQATLQNAPVTEALIGRARVHRGADRFADAQRDAARAAQLARDSGDRENLILATQELALLARQRGDPQQALRESESAVAQMEQLWAITANPDNRATLSVQLRDVYDLKIDLLAESAQRAAQLHDKTRSHELTMRALQAVNRAAELSTTRPVRTGMVPASQAIEDLYESLAGKRQRLQDLLERNATPNAATLTLQQEIAVLQSRLASQVAMATSTSFRIDDAPRDAELHLSAVPDGGAVLVFRLGARQSWMWTLTQDRAELRRLPARVVIDRLVGGLLQRVTRLGPRATIDHQLTVLRDTLFPAKLLDATERRWWVMPDGSLGAIPWALLAPDTGRSVTELASLRALVQVRKPRPGAGSLSAPARLALFGDAIFGADDARLNGAATYAEPPPMSRLARLRGTSAELDAIASLGAGSIVVRGTGAAASRSAVLNLHSDAIDVLHLATHATLDAEVPALAALVMSRFDAKGRYQPGELRPRDILRMDRPPPLVVLSACDTAAEPSKNAPGLMNLSRAFLSAGSQNVVASLWPVSDAGAVEFMTQFYRGLLSERLRPDAALAFAQAKLARSERFAEPFFWSGFVLVSEEF